MHNMLFISSMESTAIVMGVFGTKFQLLEITYNLSKLIIYRRVSYSRGCKTPS